MGLGGGQMMGLTVGGPSRQEYVIAGDCIAQVAAAEGAALDGETVLSAEAIARLDESVRATFVDEIHKDGTGMGVLKKGIEEHGWSMLNLDVKSSNRIKWKGQLEDRVRASEAETELVVDQLRRFVPSFVGETIDSKLYDEMIGGLR